MKAFLKTITAIAAVFMATVGYGQVLSSGFFGNHVQVLKTGAEQYANAAGAKAFVHPVQGYAGTYNYEYRKDGSNYTIFIGIPAASMSVEYDGRTIASGTGSYTVEGVVLEVYHSTTGYKKPLKLTVNNTWGKGKQYKVTAFTEADVQNVINKDKSINKHIPKAAAISGFRVRIISNGTLTASSFPTAEVKKKIQEAKAPKKVPERQAINLNKIAPATEKPATEPAKPKPTPKSDEKIRAIKGQELSEIKPGDIVYFNYGFIKIQDVHLDNRNYLNATGYYVQRRGNPEDIEVKHTSSVIYSVSTTTQEVKDFVEACIKAGERKLGEEDKAKFKELKSKYDKLVDEERQKWNEK